MFSSSVVEDRVGFWEHSLRGLYQSESILHIGRLARDSCLE